MGKWGNKTQSILIDHLKKLSTHIIIEQVYYCQVLFVTLKIVYGIAKFDLLDLTL